MKSNIPKNLHTKQKFINGYLGLDSSSDLTFLTEFFVKVKKFTYISENVKTCAPNHEKRNDSIIKKIICRKGVKQK